MSAQLTIAGNLTADPELRYTQAGRAVVNLTIAHTPRQKNQQTGEWEDAEPVFQPVTVWADMAENVADTLVKGSRVIATGQLSASSWDDRQTGEKRTRHVLTAEEIGPSLRWATATVNRAQRSQQRTAYQAPTQADTRRGYAVAPNRNPQAADPWAHSAP